MDLNRTVFGMAQHGWYQNC